MLKRMLTALFLGATLAAPALADRADEKPGIAALAPKDSWVIVATDHWDTMRTQWNSNVIAGLTSDPQFVAMWKGLWDMVQKETGEGDESPLPMARLFPFKDLLDDAGIKIEDLPLPSGPAGLAVYDMLEQPKVAGAEADEDEFAPRPAKVPGVMLAADFGARAGEVEESIRKAIAELVRRGEAEADETVHLGVGIRTLKLTKLEDRWKASREELAKKIEAEFKKQAGEDGLDGGYRPGDWIRRQPMPAEMRAIQTVHIAQREGLVIVGNELSVLERAIDSLDGQRVDTVSERASFQTARRFIGEEAVLYAMVLTDVFAEAAAKERAADEPAAGPFGMPAVAGRLLGISGTKALTMGIYLDTDRGPLEMRIGMLHPKLGGLLSLFDSAPAGYTPPPFAPSDADGAGVTYVKFDRIFPTVRDILKAAPPDESPIPEAQLAQAEGLVAPVLASMGPAVHVVSTTTRPLSHESNQTTVAIQLKDAAPLTNVIVGFGGGFLKPRDFEGNQIFETDDRGLGVRISIGLGFGYAFIGTPAGVENAMRLAGRTGSGLANKPGFREAAAGFKPGAAAYMYQDMRSTLELALWMLKNPPAPLDFDFDAEGRPVRKAAEPPPAPEWTKLLPEVDQWLKYLGDPLAEVRVTNQGIEMISWYRAPKP